MKRREFIGIAAVGAAGVVLPAPSRGEGSFAPTLAHPRLLEILHDERRVRDLGRRYRENVPGEDTPDALAHAILREPSARGRGPISTRSSEMVALRARVDEQVQSDFADGRTVTLDGWILSLTEARQCALFSLLPA